jgi:hypothetical protein
MSLFSIVRLQRRAVALSAIALLAACSTDGPTGPGPAAAPDAPNASLLGGLVGGVTGGVGGVVNVLAQPVLASTITRTSPIAAEKAVAVIGRAGGTIRLPNAGLTVVVPYGAVNGATTFTVSAPAGTAVLYEFGPHGTRFAVPLKVTQDLRRTTYGLLGGLTLRAGYYKDGSANLSANTALVTEVLPVTLSSLLGTATFSVGHFSGYMMSTGLTSSVEENAEVDARDGW